MKADHKDLALVMVYRVFPLPHIHIYGVHRIHAIESQCLEQRGVGKAGGGNDALVARTDKRQVRIEMRNRAGYILT